MSHDEWSAIPEIGDYTIKHRNRKTESNSAVPDSVLGTWLGGSKGVGQRTCVLFQSCPRTVGHSSDVNNKQCVNRKGGEWGGQ